jgi:hypothetical protein
MCPAWEYRSQSSLNKVHCSRFRVPLALLLNTLVSFMHSSAIVFCLNSCCIDLLMFSLRNPVPCGHSLPVVWEPQVASGMLACGLSCLLVRTELKQYRVHPDCLRRCFQVSQCRAFYSRSVPVALAVLVGAVVVVVVVE